MQHLMDSLDDPSHTRPAGPDAADVGDFVVGFLAQNPFVCSLDF
jgi:hypothetical protein